MITIIFTQNGDLCLITPPLLSIFTFMKNKFKQENNLYPKTVKRKLTSSKITFTLSRDSVLIPYQVLTLLKLLFKYLPTISAKYGINTLKWQTSLGTSKYSGVKIVDNGLDFYFFFHFSFYFILFCFSFIFLFLEQLGLRFISHKLMV